MNPERDVEIRIERWLKDEAQPIPPRVLGAVREVVPRVSQLGEHRFLFPGQWSRWYDRVALAAVAVILVIVAGSNALDQQRSIPQGSRDGVPGTGVASPTADASPSPTAEASASPTASPPPSASPLAEAPAPSDPFGGTWSARDVDGSPMTVTIKGDGPTRTVAWEDLRATGCAGDRYITDSVGTIQGASIQVVGLGGCAGKPMDQAFAATWTYDPTTGTLTTPSDWTEGVGPLTWTRGPAKTDAFLGSWVATAPDGSPMTLSLAGVGMVRNVSYVDDGASRCSPGTAFLAAGTGTIGSAFRDGRFIRVAFHGSCADGASPTDYVEKYKYDLVTDTLVGPLAPLEIGGDALPQTVTWRQV
jgi:hypothetical protein